MESLRIAGTSEEVALLNSLSRGSLAVEPYLCQLYLGERDLRMDDVTTSISEVNDIHIPELLSGGS